MGDCGLHRPRPMLPRMTKAGGFSLVRGSKNLNPEILPAWLGDGGLVPKLTGMSLKGVEWRHRLAEVTDMAVKSGKDEYRLSRRWLAEEKRFRVRVNNLPRDTWPGERVMRLYTCRWQGCCSSTTTFRAFCRASK